MLLAVNCYKLNTNNLKWPLTYNQSFMKAQLGDTTKSTADRTTDYTIYLYLHVSITTALCFNKTLFHGGSSIL